MFSIVFKKVENFSLNVFINIMFIKKKCVYERPWASVPTDNRFQLSTTENDQSEKAEKKIGKTDSDAAQTSSNFDMKQY